MPTASQFGKIDTKLIRAFQHKILSWDEVANLRKNMWNMEADPYRVWVREIMLQQTRVAQASTFYKKFLTLFPTLQILGTSPEQKVLKAWEGLGYYSRCKHLIASAKIICTKYNGVFPHTYNDIIALKGIGDYTASAILAFCFNQDYAVYDGNVERIIARYIGFTGDVKVPHNHQYLRQLANDFLVHGKAASYNQAVMDFGALICKPKNPNCNMCMLQKQCKAYQKDLQNTLPIKKPKAAPKEVFLIFIILKYKNKIAIQQKALNPIWKHLDLLPTLMVANKKQFNNSTFIAKQIASSYQIPKQGIIQLLNHASIHKQTLTNRKVFAKFIAINIGQKMELLDNLSHLKWISNSDLHHCAFPVLIRQYL